MFLKFVVEKNLSCYIGVLFDPEPGSIVDADSSVLTKTSNFLFLC